MARRSADEPSKAIQQNANEQPSLVPPPSSRALEGAVLAIENGREFIRGAKAVLAHGASPGAALALAINGLEEIGKGFAWALSIGIRQGAIGGALRARVVESHGVRMQIGAMACLIGTLVKRARENYGSEISSVITNLQAKTDIEPGSLLDNPNEAIAQAFKNGEADLEAFFRQQLNGFRERAAKAGILGPEDALTMMNSLRSSSLYVDWNSSSDTFTSPQTISPEVVDSFLQEFATGAEIAEMFVNGLYEGAKTGHLRAIQRAAKRSWWYLEMLLAREGEA